MQIREKPLIDEITEVVTRQSRVVVEFAIPAFWGGPGLPSIRFFENVGVSFPVQFGFGSFVLLESIEVFEEKQPRRLLRVIQFRRATSLFPENVVDIFKGLLKHEVNLSASRRDSPQHDSNANEWNQNQEV